jgi:hypothetical protein
MKKIASAFGVAILGNLVVFGAFNLLLMMVGCMHGDTGNHAIAGSPAQDSAGMSYWLHWSHWSFYIFPWIEGATVVLAIIFGVLSRGADDPDVKLEP